MGGDILLKCIQCVIIAASVGLLLLIQTATVILQYSPKLAFSPNLDITHNVCVGGSTRCNVIMPCCVGTVCVLCGHISLSMQLLKFELAVCGFITS